MSEENGVADIAYPGVEAAPPTAPQGTARPTFKVTFEDHAETITVTQGDLVRFSGVHGRGADIDRQDDMLWLIYFRAHGRFPKSMMELADWADAIVDVSEVDEAPSPAGPDPTPVSSPT